MDKKNKNIFSVLIVGCIGTVLLIIFAFGILTLLGFSFFTIKRNETEDITEVKVVSDGNNEPQEPSEENTIGQEELESQAEEIIESQDMFIDELIYEDMSEAEIESRLLDLISPLGPLDPLAKEKGSGYISASQNMSFGYFFSKYGFTQERTLELVELPLNYARNDFDEELYFNENQQLLNEINSEISDIEEIEILAYWSSGLNRVNNIFSDGEQDIMWKLNEPEGLFYDFAKVEVYNLVDAVNTMPEFDDFDYGALQPIKNDMASINVSVIYKCRSNIIYILGATADNGFGYIYGADEAENVNCCLLSERFEIIESKEMDDDWIFWIGR